VPQYGQRGGIVHAPRCRYGRENRIEEGQDMDERLGMSAAELGRAIGRGAVDPVDLTRACLDAAAAHPMGARIYARLTPERAEAEAHAAAERARAGQRLSPLDGVPASWKDLFDTAGVATEAGSALLAGRVPERDARVLRNATAGGLVCLGKTHMSELAFSGLGLNPITETAPCVHDPARVAGGSSSGAAASIAHGLAPVAVGSDTGGSVRIPAAWNDLVGLKTTHGRLSLEGVVPLCETFDTVGPLARTVEDAALMLGLLEGGPAPDLRGASLKGRRFAALQTVVMDDLDDAPARAFADATAALQDAGAQITPLEAPEVAHAMELSGVLFTTDAYGYWRDSIEAHPEAMYPPILERFRAGQAHSGPDYVAGWIALRHYRAQWAARVAGFDGVLMPSCPSVPPEIDRLQTDGAYYVRENLRVLRNTRVANLMGLCAVTLPTGVPSSGLMIASTGREESLLRIAHAAEAALAG